MSDGPVSDVNRKLWSMFTEVVDIVVCVINAINRSCASEVC